MRTIQVNDIIYQNGVTHGLVVLPKTIKETMPVIFSPEVRMIFAKVGASRPEGFHSIDRFEHFVVLTTFTHELGFSLKLSDYHNNVDVALDEYSFLKGKDWAEEDRDKIMAIFQDIEANPSTDPMTMVVVDPVR